MTTHAQPLRIRLGWMLIAIVLSALVQPTQAAGRALQRHQAMIDRHHGRIAQTHSRLGQRAILGQSLCHDCRRHIDGCGCVVLDDGIDRFDAVGLKLTGRHGLRHQDQWVTQRHGRGRH